MAARVSLAATVKARHSASTSRDTRASCTSVPRLLKEPAARTKIWTTSSTKGRVSSAAGRNAWPGSEAEEALSAAASRVPARPFGGSDLTPDSTAAAIASEHPRMYLSSRRFSRVEHRCINTSTPASATTCVSSWPLSSALEALMLWVVVCGCKASAHSSSSPSMLALRYATSASTISSIWTPSSPVKARPAPTGPAPESG
mmetsp:Transcript_40192/g.95404  ORF Transcript_40192/g.95404 Transcript_40192/m.95404 type:complete len:201 (+) Transcript_40192:527-1129(+)